MGRVLIDSNPPYRSFGRSDLHRLPHLTGLTADQRVAIEAAAAVVPFKVNAYVLDQLIDWSDIPSDPIFQLTFPQAGMLERQDFANLRDLVVRGDEEILKRKARAVQLAMNPHPAGQLDLNVPRLEGEVLEGAQHKYRETLLFFPSQGQTCHAYCTYCFRWAQFAGISELKVSNRDAGQLAEYVVRHPELTDILVTGGDPLIMSSRVLRRYIEPLLADEAEHITSIRIGTKSLGYWPFRFLSDPDSDDLLRLFEDVVRRGKQLALMAHFSHYRELETSASQDAMRRIRNTGAVIRCQAPLIRHVNDKSEVWSKMWRLQVQAGTIPYYSFIQRNTGPRHYFEVPLARALRIFTRAYSDVSGLARTVRGPSMSASPGKILIDGVADIGGERVFVLKMIQGRDPAWVNRVFFARFDPAAVWLDDLEPAFGESDFFFGPSMKALYAGAWKPEWAVDADEVQVSA